jgi:hypothetical protein
MSNALINYIPINSKAFKDTKNFHSGTLDGRINRAQSYLDNLDNVTHDLKVAGDFGLSAGKVVELLVSQSIDPTVTVKGAKETNPIDRYDDALSGRHLITSVVHNFAEEYFCEMKIKKDSVSVSYYE